MSSDPAAELMSDPIDARFTTSTLQHLTTLRRLVSYNEYQATLGIVREQARRDFEREQAALEQQKRDRERDAQRAAAAAANMPPGFLDLGDLPVDVQQRLIAIRQQGDLIAYAAKVGEARWAAAKAK